MALRATVPAATWGCAGHDPARRAVRPDRSVTRAHARTRARAQTQTPTDPLHCHEERGLAEGGGRCAADSRIGHGGSRARLCTPGNDAAEQPRCGYHEHPRGARGPQRSCSCSRGCKVHGPGRAERRSRPVGGQAGWDTRDLSSDDAAALQHTQRSHPEFSGTRWQKVQASSNESEEGYGGGGGGDSPKEREREGER